MTHPVKHISISINAPAEQIYDFVIDGNNLPKWAEGLSRSSIVQDGADWICDSPMGDVRVRFADVNRLGVMDHAVTLPNGEVNMNPFRVIPNLDGSEVTFTLFRLPRMTDEEFHQDAQQIEKDLKSLKQILERRS